MRIADLGPAEAVVVESHPAASALVWPAAWFVVLGAGVGTALGWLPPAWRPIGVPVVAVAAALLALGLVVVPLVRWVGQECVLTTYRLRVRRGLVRRTTHDVLLSHVQEIEHARSAWQKLKGAGTLLVTTTAGSVVAVPDLPEIERWHALVAELAWAQRAGLPDRPA